MAVIDQSRYAALIRRYFDACNEADYDKLVSCFTPDAVHYFPAGLPDIPWRTADVIARKWQWCVENLGSQWTIERILVSHDSHEAVIEWTHWKAKLGKALRGDSGMSSMKPADSSKRFARITHRRRTRT